MISEFLHNIINDFSLEKFTRFFRDKNRSFSPRQESFDYYNDESFIDGLKIGEIKFPETEQLIVCGFKVQQPLSERSGKKAQYEKGKQILKETQYDAGIFIFYDQEGNFRFSLIYQETIENRRQWANFRRFTYFVSRKFTNKTFLQQVGEGDFSSLQKIKEAFSVEPVTKQFYNELQSWYFWAMDRIKFPDDYKYSYDSAKDEEIRSATNLIRLITRIIFIWFLTEKGLISPDLFSREKLGKIVKDFMKNKEASNFYNAILQNLFFGTLNQKMKERKFAQENDFQTNKKEYGVKNLYRYEDKFLIDKSEALKLFEDIPFLNGGLFDCLDKEDESKKVIYIDGFSRNPAKQSIIPDYLLFQQEEERVNLSNYGLGSNRLVKGLLEILNSYNFTIDESTAVDQEIALDPELLGKVFENLLASYNPETATTARKATGSYYTPREIVDYMVQESLIAYLMTAVAHHSCESGIAITNKSRQSKSPDEIASDSITPCHDSESRLRHLLLYTDEPHMFSEAETKKIISAIDALKILDPACGSGAFPMGILHKLVYTLQKLDPENKYWHELQYQKALKESGEVFEQSDKNERQERLVEINEAFDESINYPDYARKLYLIENCIYGVDIQPIAIQISKLRFFISLVLDQKIDRTKENLGIRALPNLETKFVAANTLMGLDGPLQDIFYVYKIKEFENEINLVRHKYFQTKTRREKLGCQKKDRELRTLLAKELENMGFPFESSKKIAAFDLYDQNGSTDWFDSEWMFGVKEGFDVVIGNPPYGAEMDNVDRLAENYRYFDRQKNSASFFIEAGGKLTNSKGIVTYIIPKSLSFSEGWKKTRELVTDRNRLLSVIDVSKAFEAVLLEQIIICFSKETASGIYQFSVGEGWGSEIIVRDKVDNRLIDHLDILPIYVDNRKQGILNKLQQGSILLSKISKTFRGLPFQSKVSKSGQPILRGKNIGKYKIYGNIDKIFLPKEILSSAKVKEILSPKILSQNIVAHVMNPYDRIIIMATIDKEGLLTLDTVMNTYLTADRFSLQYVLAILNSRFASWFYYWFVFNRAIRTMHFDKYYIGKLPIKEIDLQIQQPFITIVSQILSLKKSAPNANTSTLEQEIDQMVYQLYNLTEDEIKIIEGGEM